MAASTWLYEGAQHPSVFGGAWSCVPPQRLQACNISSLSFVMGMLATVVREGRHGTVRDGNGAARLDSQRASQPRWLRRVTIVVDMKLIIVIGESVHGAAHSSSSRRGWAWNSSW